MRYYTKEFYEMMQKQHYTLGMEKIPDKDYTGEEIKAFYNKKLKKEIAHDKRCYQTPPSYSYLLDILGREPFQPEDWLIVNEGTGECVLPKTREEVRSDILARQKRAETEFQERPLFDSRETEEFFEADYKQRIKNVKHMGLPAWAYEAVDARLLALGLLPESVYIRLKQEEKVYRKEVQRIKRDAGRVLQKERERIPARILEKFHYHDAKILSFRKCGKDYGMLLRLDGYWDEPYELVWFRQAVILEKEYGIVIRKHITEDGEYDSNYVFLDHEMYGLKTGGYEVHMIVCGHDSKYITLQCQDIQFEKENIG